MCASATDAEIATVAKNGFLLAKTANVKRQVKMGGKEESQRSKVKREERKKNKEATKATEASDLDSDKILQFDCNEGTLSYLHKQRNMLTFFLILKSADEQNYVGPT